MLSIKFAAQGLCFCTEAPEHAASQAFHSKHLPMCAGPALYSIRLLCVTIANHGAPEYAIGSLTLELLQSEGSNWDATMIGLRALLSVVMTAPLRLAGGKKFDPAVS